MAKSNFEYVRDFEHETRCLPNTWIVVRIDGKGFHRFADLHDFVKPNDTRGLTLMARAAADVMFEFTDVIISFGHSDEFSFVFRKNTAVFNRRAEKLSSLVTSLFSSSYVFHWNDHFPDTKLRYPPAFDSRIVLYPTDENMKDYLSWRQADVHVNNLYNLSFWSLVLKGGLKPCEAELKLRGTLASDKNELLFQEFGINYNQEPPMFRKGTTLLRKSVDFLGKGKRTIVMPYYCDIIKKDFWDTHPELLKQGKAGSVEFHEGMEFFEIKKCS
ncbi:unnamed protein product [Nesidiocoris tenuis]|uniref:tRNAHis guanylyltransferase n=2 Tax=Nesidiocoris tenuis TaxID=355587 RepID=A0ABN7AEH0_9HEMI|nr:tRNAHis guanylyltransferase [Nesidiocoris tenuis]CAB0020855.1 unnamed protein product [Nesidiocoris tenuis]